MEPEPSQSFDQTMAQGQGQVYPVQPNITHDQEMGGTGDTNGTNATPIVNNAFDMNDQMHNMPRSSHSSDFPTTQPAFSPPPDLDPNTRYASPPIYQQPFQSRPSSGLSGSERHGYAHSQPDTRSTAYQDQNVRPSHQQGDQAARNNKSVVIKVGMVGDAQIGKTSLMVKYVEGSWDEDYIQTLGMLA